MMKKLPIGIHTFSEIITDNYVYIDKTQEAYQLLNTYKYVFLSRPRRFGKSLFLTTLQAIFEGKKELFKGLYIYDKYDFEAYPVIRIVFSGVMSTKESLGDVINRNMRNNEEDLQCERNEQLSPTERFAALIKNAAKKYHKRVVILIDEYDKPILDNITDPAMRSYARNMLKGLYEHIKYNDEYIKFAFLTGVSKFSKVSIFSGLNNIEDISLYPQYGNICGYTQADLETSFQPYLAGADMEKVKRWYDGYNFLKDNVYNPFDILKFCANGHLYKNYWFETGSPSFLINLIKEKNYYVPQLENIVIGEEQLGAFDIEKINFEVLLYQSGYLTIAEEKRIEDIAFYSLKIPNLEVKSSLNRVIISMLTEAEADSADTIGSTLYRNMLPALFNADMEGIKDTLHTLFASLPYQNYANNNISLYEGFYASVVYAFLASLGVPLIGEDTTNRGRIDLTLTMEQKVYIIEFKVGSGNALEQIKAKKYYEKYRNMNKDIYLVGINFDEAERNISGFTWETV
ncbi:MAG: ATP-binding protein [Treponema sp.]|uniref:ATP-binding protein n=2 Tax=Treponema sp. TaxID=166 RepID=UPI003FA1D917